VVHYVTSKVAVKSKRIKAAKSPQSITNKIIIIIIIIIMTK